MFGTVSRYQNCQGLSQPTLRSSWHLGYLRYHLGYFLCKIGFYLLSLGFLLVTISTFRYHAVNPWPRRDSTDLPIRRDVISLKKLIESNHEEMLRGTLRAYRAALEAMGNSGVQACPPAGAQLQLDRKS